MCIGEGVCDGDGGATTDVPPHVGVAHECVNGMIDEHVVVVCGDVIVNVVVNGVHDTTTLNDVSAGLTVLSLVLVLIPVWQPHDVCVTHRCVYVGCGGDGVVNIAVWCGIVESGKGGSAGGARGGTDGDGSVDADGGTG